MQALEAGIADPVQMAEVPTSYGAPPAVDAVTGSDCANGGCTVLVADGSTTVAETTSEGYEKVLAGRDLRVTGISPDGRLWAGTTMPTGDRQLGCAELYDPEADGVVARSCSADRSEFSPDGQHLLSRGGGNNQAGDSPCWTSTSRWSPTSRPARVR